MIIHNYKCKFCTVLAKISRILMQLLKLYNKIIVKVKSLSMERQFMIVQLAFPYTLLLA